WVPRAIAGPFGSNYAGSSKISQPVRDLVLFCAISTRKTGSGCHKIRSPTEPKINHRTASFWLNMRHVTAGKPNHGLAFIGLQRNRRAARRTRDDPPVGGACSRH